ncbi:MAG TPA: metallophosphoesterase [Polyangia bacterium]|nr:metallophosphoesterase [Polyangia bacterium]
MAIRHKGVETKFMEEREAALRQLNGLDRRTFLKTAAAAAGAVMAGGIIAPHSFQLVNIAHAAPSKAEGVRGMSGKTPFSFAYISDTHLYEKGLNERFVRSVLKAVEDVNALDPQPDFVFFGGDLAQLGAPKELELGAQILKEVKAPVKMMVGEHDWYLDLGDKWQELFGPPTYSFDWKGVHCVVLMSVLERDFWTARKMTPQERMHTVAGLDNGTQSRFEVGEAGRNWLKSDLAKVAHDTPLIVFSHSPLYKYYRDWNFWTEDADEVQAILRPYKQVTVLHGHTHQMLSNRIGNIDFHGFLSTAWPWPYAPQGLPPLTIQMNRADPFDQFDGCGDGRVNVGDGGLVEKIYNLWDRNPVSIKHSYLASNGGKDRPSATTRGSY